jgi:adenylyltransferase/sulfurtransferase
VGDWLSRYDVVVECSDNFATKFVVNDAAVSLAKPAVFASVYQYEGQLQVYLPREDWPCLRCLWPEAPRDGLVGNCAEAGVLGPVPATLGSMQAMLVLRILLGIEPAPPRGLVVVDLLTLATSSIAAARNPECAHTPGDAPAEPPEADQDDARATQSTEVGYPSLEDARAAGFTLVDVREAWEVAQDPPGLDTGEHIPLSELLDGRASFPADGRHLVVCAHGVRSLALVERLREMGRSEVYSLSGGLAALERRPTA